MRLKSLWIVLTILLAAHTAFGSPESVSLYREGVAAAKAEKYDTALTKLEAAATAEPNNLLFGTAYRQAVIAAAGTEKKELYERAIAFFEKLVEANPKAPNAYLNLAFANVDKIPAEGAITQVILANTSLGHFASALELEETWLGYYSRGHAYLFWPTIFGRAPMGIADLEKAVAISKKDEEPREYYARAWAALGDGHWRLDDLEKARKIWREALVIFPEDHELKERVAFEDQEKLDQYLEAHYDTTRRVGTHLREIYGDGE